MARTQVAKAATSFNSRLLIVNADDFGRTGAINRGVITAYESGVVTSASLMVRWPACDEAADYARTHGGLGVGLHLDLGEWVHTSSGWEANYEVVACDRADEVAGELERQIDRFQMIVGRAPTHIDSHQHVHRSEPARTVVADAARRLRIPLREVTPGITYCGGFYGQLGDGTPYPQGITLKTFLRLLDSLGPGLTELSCHPGVGEDFGSTYARERVTELQVLCDPMIELARRTRGINLASYADVVPVGSESFEPGRKVHLDTA